MLSVAICDDEILACIDIDRQVKKVLTDKRITHTTNCFSSGQALIDSALNFDIIFLDIKMATLDGIETAKVLRNRGCSSMLIFITSSADYMLKAFDVEAFHYIIKPVDKKSLEKILLRARDKILPFEEDFIVINHERQVVKLPLSKTMYFEINGRVIKAHMVDSIYNFYEQIGILEQKLPQDKFYRCHKSYLVNLGYTKGFEKTDILLNNGKKIPLSKRRYDGFATAFLLSIKKEGGML